MGTFATSSSPPPGSVWSWRKAASTTRPEARTALANSASSFGVARRREVDVEGDRVRAGRVEPAHRLRVDAARPRPVGKRAHALRVDRDQRDVRKIRRRLGRLRRADADQCVCGQPREGRRDARGDHERRRDRDGGRGGGGLDQAAGGSQGCTSAHACREKIVTSERHLEDAGHAGRPGSCRLPDLQPPWKIFVKLGWPVAAVSPPSTTIAAPVT